MESLETLLTSLEVSPSGDLVAGFRSLGELTFPSWINTFCFKLGRKWDTKPFEELIELKKKLAESSNRDIHLASTDENKYRTISKDWLVYQIDLPISSKEDLPKGFILGNYTKQARFKLKSPWHYVPLPSNLLEGLKTRQELQFELESLRNSFRRSYEESGISSVFNDLIRKSQKYNGSNMEEIVSSIRAKKLSSEQIERILDIQKKILTTNTILNGSAKISYKPLVGKNAGNILRLDADNWEFLEKGRIITSRELFNDQTLFLDIEIPKFRTSNPLISWIGSCFLSEQKKRYAIDTIHDLGMSELEDFAINSHVSEEELINAFRRRIVAVNPIAISAHNAKFDLIKLRESNAGFTIGDSKTPPLYKATTPFFERMGIKDRLVLDTMRWYKIANAYDINAKLAMMTGEEKSISYDEMESLETGSLEDKLCIAKYLTEDIRGPVEKVLMSSKFKKNIEDVLTIADKFNISPERLLHSTSCINEAQEKVYFEELGIHREEIPPNQRTTIMQKKREKARGVFSRLVTEKGINFETQRGLFQDVCKVYIPVGNILKELVSHRFPKAKELYDYRDQHTNDKQRLFFIDQYSHALSKWLIEGYGEFLTETEKLGTLWQKKDYYALNKVYNSLKTRASNNHPDDLSALSSGRLTESNLKRMISPEAVELMNSECLDSKRLLDILNTYSRFGRIERRFIGNFDVFPSKGSVKRRGTYIKQEPKVVSEVLRKEFGIINEFLSKNELKVIAQEGNYLYLNGDKRPLVVADSPLTLVDEIPQLYSADNPYYKKNGFYSHLRLSDDPTYNMSTFEMKSWQPILDKLLKGDFDSAKDIYARSRDLLERKEIPAEEMIFRNKSTNRDFIYSNTSEGKIHFVRSIESVPQGVEIDINDIGKFFYDVESEQPIYILSPKETEGFIDKKMYFDRFVKRGRAMLGPIMSSRTKETFNPGQMTLNL